MEAQTKKTETQPEVKLVMKVALAIASVMLLAVAAYVFRFHNHPAGDPDAWGQFGDYFGGLLNPALGSFSVLALIYTVYLQTKTLEATREQLDVSQEELKNSSAELKRSSEAFESQNQILRIQTFETTLFNMLSNNRSMRDAVTTENSRVPNDFGPKMTGQTALVQTLNMFRDQLNNVAQDNNNATRDDFKIALSQVEPNHGEVFGSYVRNSHAILTFIATALKDIRHPGILDSTRQVQQQFDQLIKSVEGTTETYTLDSQRLFYADIFASQLTQTELELILACAVASDNAGLVKCIRNLKFPRHLNPTTPTAMSIKSLLS